MPRHAFSFPPEVRQQVKNYIDERVAAIEPRRFNQESKYVSALLSKLEGIVYEGNSGFVRFDVTDIDDRGRRSAESFSGADFAITATISNNSTSVQKAILCQAKLGEIKELNTNKSIFLDEQIRKMKHFTRSPKVMEVIEVNGVRHPRIISGNKLLEVKPYSSIEFSDYIIRRVLTTFDGDTRSSFVEAVQDSSLPKLKVKAFTPITK